jgi:hypothetical protein
MAAVTPVHGALHVMTLRAKAAAKRSCKGLKQAWAQAAGLAAVPTTG